MQEQNRNTQAQAPTQEAAPTPRRTWQRPTLQRLHVSLDTTNRNGSSSDGGTPSSI